MTLSYILSAKCRGLSEGNAAVATALAVFFGLWVVPKSSKYGVTASISAHPLLQYYRPQAEQILKIRSAIHLQICGFFDGDEGYEGWERCISVLAASAIQFHIPAHPQAVLLRCTAGTPVGACWTGWKRCRSIRTRQPEGQPPPAWSCLAVQCTT